VSTEKKNLAMMLGNNTGVASIGSE